MNSLVKRGLLLAAVMAMLAACATETIATPDDLSGLRGAILVYDDDNYAVGSALAEKLKREGHDVTYVTAQPLVSAWNFTQLHDGARPTITKLLSAR